MISPGVLPGRRKRIHTTVVKYIASVAVEASSESHFSELERYREMLQNYVIPTATSVPTRNHIHERWSPTSQRELSPIIVKTGIGRRTYEQPIFLNSLASTITISHAL
ncbi:hypothetical protein TNCV_121911 [Trichonephila clavipes]|nr:hypothetical protein TNCV_121911 [Trichonephila clavipes]